MPSISRGSSGRRERAALFDAATAVWEAFYGNAAAARQKVATALDLASGRDVDYAAAFALVLSGDVARSRALADDLAKNFPEDTSVQYMYLPTLRALFALNAHDAAAAIHALQTATRYDLALGGIGFIGRFGGLYPIYVRGLAYLAAHQPAQAAVEFQRILDHRSIVLVDPMDAMARLQLARALALSGDTVKAKSAYKDLLTLWERRRPQDPYRRTSSGRIRPAAVTDGTKWIDGDFDRVWIVRIVGFRNERSPKYRLRIRARGTRSSLESPGSETLRQHAGSRSTSRTRWTSSR